MIRRMVLGLMAAEVAMSCVPELRPYVPVVVTIERVVRDVIAPAPRPPLQPPAAFLAAGCPPPSSGPDLSHCAYVVKPGEKLLSIAFRLSGGDRERCSRFLAALVRDNGIANPDHVEIGQQLLVTSEPVASRGPACAVAA